MFAFLQSIARRVQDVVGSVAQALRMAGAKKQLSFDEVVAETVERLEELARRQRAVLEELRDTVASSKGVDEVKKRIDEL